MAVATPLTYPFICEAPSIVSRTLAATLPENL